MDQKKVRRNDRFILPLFRGCLVEMMTMLLQFFLDHQCISLVDMMDWYANDNFVSEIIGTKIEKKWAEPFFHQHGCQIESSGKMNKFSPSLSIKVNSFFHSDLSTNEVTMNELTDSQMKKNVRIR